MNINEDVKIITQEMDKDKSLIDLGQTLPNIKTEKTDAEKEQQVPEAEEVAINSPTKNDELVHNLLMDNDILNKMEEGTNSTESNKTSKKTPIEDLENYINLNVEVNDYESEDENLLNVVENLKIKDMAPYKKLEFKDVEYKINQSYDDLNHRYSSALDILASYLKGHKIIYMEAKSYCETHLNFYMMPSILFSTTATVLSSYVNNFHWGPVFISSLNGIIAFLLAIVNYLKLDAASEAHKISSHQYDKLQSTVEFTSGSVLLFRYNGLQTDEYELAQLKDNFKTIKEEAKLSKENKNVSEELKNIRKEIIEKEEKIRKIGRAHV